MPQNVIPDSKRDSNILINYLFFFLSLQKRKEGLCVGLYQEVQSN